MGITLQSKQCFGSDTIKRIHFGRSLVRVKVLVGQKVVCYFKIIILLPVLYVQNTSVQLLWAETNFRIAFRSQLSSLVH